MNNVVTDGFCDESPLDLNSDWHDSFNSIIMEEYKPLSELDVRKMIIEWKPTSLPT